MWSSPADERTRSSIDRLSLLLHAEPEGDVVVHLHVREDGVALEDHRDAPSFGREVRGVPAADEDPAVVDALQPRQAAKERRLAAARGTEQHHELPIVDLQVDAVDGGELAEVLPHTLERDLSHRLGAPFEPAWSPPEAVHRSLPRVTGPPAPMSSAGTCG